jgi:hypothetical protein
MGEWDLVTTSVFVLGKTVIIESEETPLRM